MSVKMISVQKPDPCSAACSRCIAEELKPENVAPLHDKPMLFVRSQWCRQITVVYLLYRVLVAALVIAWMVGDLTSEASTFYSFDYGLWMLYATNWDFMMLCLSCILMAVCTVYYYVRIRHTDREPSESLSPGLIVMWIVYNIAANGAIVVSVAYWAFVILFDPSSVLTTRLAYVKHTLNTIYVLADLFIVAVPVRLFHLVYPLTLGVIYAVFNALYFAGENAGPFGKPYVYDTMDWRKNPLGSTLTCVIGFLLCVLAQCLLFSLYRLRLWLADTYAVWRKVREPDSDTAPLTYSTETDAIFKTVPEPNRYSSVDDLQLSNK